MKKLLWNSLVCETETFHVARTKITPAKPPHRHTHDFCEICWIESGSCMHEMNGKKSALETGSLLIIRESDTHDFLSSAQRTCVLVNVAFPVMTLRYLLGRYFPSWHDRLLYGAMPYDFHLKPGDIAPLGTAADELSAAPRTTFHIERFIMEICARIGLDRQEGHQTGHLPPWLSHALERIHEPRHFRAGVSGFVALCNRSPEHVGRTVRRCTGRTVSETVNRARVRWAMRRLAMSDNGIYHIALDCGISSLAWFHRLFKQECGMSPRRYRMSCRRSIG